MKVLTVQILMPKRLKDPKDTQESTKDPLQKTATKITINISAKMASEIAIKILEDATGYKNAKIKKIVQPEMNRVTDFTTQTIEEEYDRGFTQMHYVTHCTRLPQKVCPNY